MNWRQLFPPHISKGYTLDLLFASSDSCVYNSIDEDLVPRDPEHNDSAFFRIAVNASVGAWQNSKNVQVKNFYRPNYEALNTLLDIDWDHQIGDADIVSSLTRFMPK